MLRPAHSDLINRRPVWQALSDLFLDTSFDDGDRERIARALAGSPYGVEDLEQILLREVYPACLWNLYSIAGEWAGFDADWLEARILRGPSMFMRAWTAALGRTSTSLSVEWRHIREQVIAIRAG